MTKPDSGRLNKKLRIPNADVYLDDVEVEIINTREFQRLFNLKQLGLAYLVYPGATHTRGIHSIETLYQAGKILDALESNGFEIDQADRDAVRLAALLHDIGHVPFSHILEDEHIVLRKPHDGSARLDDVFKLLRDSLRANIQSQKLYDKIDSRLNAAHTILLSIASKDDNDKDWKSDIVGNTICADLLAYINADAAWTGIEKRPGHYRIYEYFRLEDKHCKREVETANGKVESRTWTQRRLCVDLTKNGVLRVDIVSSILDILDIRYAITERVLFHHAKCVASAMLARAARLCNLADSECKCLAEDEHLPEGAEKRCLIQMGDEAFLDFLERRAKENNLGGALNLVRSIKSRQLYKRVFKISRQMKDAYDSEMPDSTNFIALWRDPERVEELLSAIENELDLQRGDLVLWCSDAKSGMKAVKVNVTWKREGRYAEPKPLREVTGFPTVHQRVEAIEKQYSDLWYFWVAVDKRHASRTPEIIEAIEKRVRLNCDKSFKESLLQDSDDAAPQEQEENEGVERMCRDFVAEFVPAMNKYFSEISAPALDGNDQEISRTLFNQVALNWLEAQTSAPSKGKTSRKRKTSGQKLFPEDEPKE